MLPIRLRGAATHNLKRMDVDLQPGQFIALTGRSGSGKSSLALDTLYAEGQRRFVESFSPYARQFLERLERPPMDGLDPVAATVAVDRRAPVKSSRSTLATMADLEPYLAGLFAREALPTCPDCNKPAVQTTAHAATDRVLSQVEGRAVVSYPVHVPSADDFLELRESLAKDGYRRLVVGGAIRDIDEIRPSEVAGAAVAVHVVVDRVNVAQKNGQKNGQNSGASDKRRLLEAIEVAWARSDGRAELRFDSAEGSPAKRVPVVRGLVCEDCGRSFEPARAALFSYNSPLGACDECRGFGRVISVDWDKVIPDHRKSLKQGAIRAWAGASAEWEREQLAAFAKRKKIPFDKPWGELSDEQRELVLVGEGSWDNGKFPGVRAWFKWLESRAYKMHVRVLLSRYREYTTCRACHGARINKTALSYRVGGENLAQWHSFTVSEALQRVQSLQTRDPQGERLREALACRVRYLEAVGLGYLTLDRQSRTLSGGEAQRANLTMALGASLTGTLFVLDEPTVGLHPTDIPPLAEAMRELADAGNTVLVVEHDEQIVRRCERVIEIGPHAGKHGGEILFDGTPTDLAKRTDLPTGRAWRRLQEAQKSERRTAAGFLRVNGASANNLKNVDVKIPLGVVCAITGPSGSGKSTLAEEVVYRGVARALGEMTIDKAGAFRSLEGVSNFSRASLVDQAPLGRTARGNAATYTKAWDRIRTRFAAEPAAVARQLTAGHFSFNVALGRCDACAGEGYETVEMQFLADVALLCPVCQGKRFKPEVLEVRHLGKTIADVLEMTVEDVLAHFDPQGTPPTGGDHRDYVLRRALEPIVRVGLGYLPLGQPLSTLSGGEAQRLKLARALTEPARGALFVIDEPSAGLHAEDVADVIKAIDTLVSEGASVLVVEHDTEIVRAADWVIDLGPGAGPLGGSIVAEGTPEEMARTDTRTGMALRQLEHPEEVRARSVLPAPDAIWVEHAREHNLKEVSCKIPHGQLSVVTGPSGSGKSSLAFDVVFAEGQRRFMETLTPYARQFLPTLPRADVDSVTGVPPSIALEQRTTRGGANSTVATVTEVAHYLRLLYAKVGDLFCPECEAPVHAASPDGIFADLTKRERAAKPFTLFAPAVRARKGTYVDLFTQASRAGLQAARVDGAIVSIDPPPKLAKTKEHSIDLIVYYGPLQSLERATFDRALQWGDGAIRLASGPPTASPTPGEKILSTSRACSKCGTGVPELDPRWFSFNTKQGQCEACEGTGVHGGHEAIENGARIGPCKECNGTRLAPIPRRVQVHGETYAGFVSLDVKSALARARRWQFEGSSAAIAKAPHAELVRRLEFVDQVGLGYLPLDRGASTLSGGEMQRLRLSAQLGSGLTGALYVLDEPTIGLHPRDTRALIRNLRALVDTGSTVVVVEHDAETIRAADHVLDLGPGGGRNGGHIVCEGPARDVLSNPRSPTARALEQTARVDRPKRPMADAWIELAGARANNLKDATFRVPVGRMCVVAGVSGSGKSTLVRQVFYPALRKGLGLVADSPGQFGSLKGYKTVRRALAVDQSPIGRTPRSVPATFLGIWDHIRRFFAGLPEARARGYTPARFSFNTANGGRCPTCEGQGMRISEMPFLPDVVTPCEDCGGMRFEAATLDVRFTPTHLRGYSDLSIGDVLHLSADDAADVFMNHPKIARPLETLRELGVGYVQLGQGSNTLSGGEAQRLKLAAELTAGSAHEATVYVLDEPTTGLHLSDVRRLINMLERLVARGDTLVIVEHHPDVIASADWVIELGPEAGSLGGKIVFEGPPAKLGRAKTATGKFFSSESSGETL